MRLAYVDEAGLSNLAHEPKLVVAAVIVHGDYQLNEVQKALERIKAKYLPADVRDSFIFHATELFNGGGPVFRRGDPKWPLVRRLEIADQLARVPSKSEVRIVYGHMNREEFLRRYSATTMSLRDQERACLSATFISAAALVEACMRKFHKNENCLIIAEDNQNARQLLQEVHNANQDQKRVADLSEFSRRFFPFRHIRENILFQPKRPNSPMELADFAAYVIKRMAMNRSDTRYGRFAVPLWSQVWQPSMHSIPKPPRMP